MGIKITSPVIRQVNFDPKNSSITLDYFKAEVKKYLGENTDGSIIVRTDDFQSGIILVVQNVAQKTSSNIDQAAERIAKILKQFKTDPDPSTIL